MNFLHSDYLEENVLHIFTDGSSLPKPRRGGIGIRLVYVDHYGQEKIEDFPDYYSYVNATNNQMELYACIKGIEIACKSKYYQQAHKIVIFTDSQYVFNNYKNALFYWQKNNWLTRDKNPVLNVDLWKKLLNRISKSGKRLEIKWVKGHAKNEHNKAADKLAKQSARSPLKKGPLSIVKVRRKKTNRIINLHSVEMKGQRIAIRIITEEYLKKQKINKYKYEVISKGSKYFGFVDIIFSNVYLKAGHEYFVTLSKDSKRPRILKLIKEITNDKNV